MLRGEKRLEERQAGGREGSDCRRNPRVCTRQGHARGGVEPSVHYKKWWEEKVKSDILFRFWFVSFPSSPLPKEYASETRTIMISRASDGDIFSVLEQHPNRVSFPSKHVLMDFFRFPYPDFHVLSNFNIID